MSLVSRATVASCALACVLLTHSRALAGPVEVLDGVLVAPGDPDTLLLRYRNAGGGLFLSHDGGKTFSFLCNSGIEPTFRREASSAVVRKDGAILFGVFDGLWRADANACGFTKDAAFEGQWVNDFAIDPLDPSRTYAITSAGGQQNGVYLNDGKSETWKVVGGLEEILINRLHVVKTGASSVRIYESAVRGMYTEPAADGGLPEELPKYVIRYTDDLGKTWVEHEFGKTDGTLRLLAVDPTDVDHIVVGVSRDTIAAGSAVTDPDDVLWSASAGEPGSFEKVGEVTDLSGATFAPDGRLFYGDREQTTPALYAVAKLGDAPKKIASDYKVQCVNYDVQSDKLYVCEDRKLGVADSKTGEVSVLIDVTQADTFVSCEGEQNAAVRCEAQLVAGWCGITHFPNTPFCAGYGLVDASVPAADGGNLDPDAGTDGSSVREDAGDGGGAKKDDGGCSVSVVHAQPQPTRWGLGATLGLVALVLARRSRRRD